VRNRIELSNISTNNYYTVNISEMHTDPFEVRVRFDERYVVENKARYLTNHNPDEIFDRHHSLDPNLHILSAGNINIFQWIQKVRKIRTSSMQCTIGIGPRARWE